MLLLKFFGGHSISRNEVETLELAILYCPFFLTKNISTTNNYIFIVVMTNTCMCAKIPTDTWAERTFSAILGDQMYLTYIFKEVICQLGCVLGFLSLTWAAALGGRV